MKIWGMAVIVALACVGAAEAKKKPFSVAGCTAEILQKVAQTPAGRECARKQDEAFLKGGSPVYFVCTPDGSVSCCTNGPSQTTCTDVARTGGASILDQLGGGGLEISK